jgi:hypothetical protein
MKHIAAGGTGVAGMFSEPTNLLLKLAATLGAIERVEWFKILSHASVYQPERKHRQPQTTEGLGFD